MVGRENARSVLGSIVKVIVDSKLFPCLTKLFIVVNIAADGSIVVAEMRNSCLDGKDWILTWD